ncbi:hypothetical protein E2C01_002654 [Portunus trituberculatus]|uniref:Uncharacterized protein n=1 Tax=Portunus trituberculatus TaxID=210409 RepID=A0A5B7CNT2_PORTR|nr:hypothetical protein [Portunus trituberculatus]
MRPQSKRGLRITMVFCFLMLMKSVMERQLSPPLQPLRDGVTAREGREILGWVKEAKKSREESKGQGVVVAARRLKGVPDLAYTSCKAPEGGKAQFIRECVRPLPRGHAPLLTNVPSVPA